MTVPQRELYAGQRGNPNLQRDVIIIPGGVGTPIPDPPKSVKDVERWQRLWTVGRAWLSNDAHYELMRLVCETMEARDRMASRMRREAMLVTGSTGQIVAHPGWRELTSMERMVAHLLAQAGFSPAPQKVKTQPEHKSKLDEARDKIKQARTA